MAPIRRHRTPQVMTCFRQGGVEAGEARDGVVMLGESARVSDPSRPMDFEHPRHAPHAGRFVAVHAAPLEVLEVKRLVDENELSEIGQADG